jgi:Ca2+-binding RTX toxin-like protein
MVTFTATNGNDNVINDADVIDALNGDDTVEATNPVSAIVDGGEGNDLLRYEASSPGMATLFGGAGYDTLESSDGAIWASGGPDDDVITGETALTGTISTATKGTTRFTDPSMVGASLMAARATT